MKKLKIAVLVALVLFISSLGAAYFVIQAKFPPEKVKEMAATELTKILKRPSSVEGAGIQFWPLGVELSGLSIAGPDAEGFSKTPTLSLGKALLKVDLAALFTFQVRVNEVALEDLKVNLELSKKGVSSLDGLGGEKKTEVSEEKAAPLDLSSLELPVDIHLDLVALRNASVTYLDHKQNTQVVLGSINQSMELHVNKALTEIKTSGLLNIEEISLQEGNSGLKKGNIKVFFGHDIEGNLKAQTLNFKQLSTGFQSIQIDMTGEVKQFLDSNLTFAFEVQSNQIKMAELLAEIPAGISPEISKVKAGGWADLALSAKGTPLKPDLNGKLSLHQMSFAHPASPGAIKDINGVIEFSPEKVTIEPFKMLLDEHPLTLSLLLDGLPAKPYLQKLDVNTKIDLAKLIPLVEKISPLPEGLDIKGMIDANIKGKGELDPNRPEALQLNGEVKLAGIDAKLPGFEDRFLISGVSTLSNTQITQDLNVKTGPSDVKTKILIQDFLALALPEKAGGKKTTVKVDVNSNNLNLDRLMPPPTEKEAEAPASELPEEYPALPDVVVDVNVNLKSTLFKHLTLSNFKYLIHVQDGKVNTDMNANLYGGSIAQSLNMDLSDRKNGKFDFSLKTLKVEANDLISNGNNNLVGDSPLFKQLRNLDNTIFGQSDFVMNLKTSGKPADLVTNLLGEIDTKFYQGSIKEGSMFKGYNKAVGSFNKDLTMKEMSFDTFMASFDVENGNLIVKHMEFDNTPAGFLNVTGKIGLDGMLNLNLENHLPKSISTSILSKEKAGSSALAGATGMKELSSLSATPQTPDGRVKVYYFVSGPISDPNYGLDSKRMAGEGANSAKDLLASKAAEEAAKLKARADAEKKKLEDMARKEADKLKAAADKKKAEALKKKKELEAKALAEKKKAEKAAKDKAAKEAKKALKGFGF